MLLYTYHEEVDGVYSMKISGEDLENSSLSREGRLGILKAVLFKRSGAKNVSSSVFRMAHNATDDFLHLSVVFDSSAWTGLEQRKQ